MPTKLKNEENLPHAYKLFLTGEYTKKQITRHCQVTNYALNKFIKSKLTESENKQLKLFV